MKGKDLIKLIKERRAEEYEILTFDGRIGGTKVVTHTEDISNKHKVIVLGISEYKTDNNE